MQTKLARSCGAISICIVYAMFLTPGKAQPFRDNPYPKTFQWRDLRQELRNKMTGTYSVTSGGDFLWRDPIASRMSPQLRDVMRNADTTIGNLEGQIIDPRDCTSPCSFGGNWQPKEEAKALADLGVDFIAPGEFNGGSEGHLSSMKYL